MLNMDKSFLKHGSRLPTYLRITRLLRERISAGVYHPNEFLPPERELAQEFHASRQTVRQAIESLRQDGIVVPEQGRGTRVLGDPAGIANPERMAHFQLAALIIYGMSRQGSAEMFQGCQAAMQQADHHLIVCETAPEPQQRGVDEAAHLRALLEKGIGGIVIYAEPTRQNLSLLQAALARGIQVVQLDRFLPGLPCDYVGVDNVAAARDMVTHLWTLGHRRIAFLSIHPEPSTVQQRGQGYRLAMQELGSEVDEALIVHLPTQERFLDRMERALEKWLSLPEPPTAIFAVNDGLAIEVMESLQRKGVRIPQEVGVAGFDDQDLARFVSPPLTTIAQPFRQLGETAGQMLLDRMAGRYTGIPRSVFLPTRLIARQSCGVCAQAVHAAVTA
jgi:DNA-binding LacI/PurR family transcriptional regulator